MLRREKHWGRCELLVITSLLFLSPITFADLQHTLPASLSVLSGLTAFVSVALWTDPQHRVKYRIDCAMARTSGLIYTGVGVRRMPTLFLVKYGVAIWICMVSSYGASRRLGAREDPRWVVAHGLFHAFVAVGMCAVMVHC